MRLLKLACFVGLLAVAPSVARAQCPSQPPSPVVNPNNVCFPASPDHNTVQLGVSVVAGYKLTLTPPSPGTPVVTDIGKPALGTGNTITLSNWAGYGTLTPGLSYTLTVSAYGPGGTTLGGVSVPFGKVAAPGAPGAAVVTP